MGWNAKYNRPVVVCNFPIGNSQAKYCDAVHKNRRSKFQLLHFIFDIYEWISAMPLSLIATLMFLVSMGLLVTLVLQMRGQRLATETLIEDNRVRTQLFEDADESTSFILARTIQNISEGHPDPNLESDSFTLKVVTELVKRKLPKDKWLEIQCNERLVHELYLLLRDAAANKDPQPVRVKT